MKITSNHAYEIRTLQESDIPAVMEFVEACENLVLERDSMYWMLARFFGDTCFLALHEDQIIGMLFGFISQADPQTAYIQKLGTRADFRRKGLASTLLRHFEEAVQNKGVQKLFLTTYPSEENVGAITFYKQNGFDGEIFWKASKQRLGLWKQLKKDS